MRSYILLPFALMAIIMVNSYASKSKATYDKSTEAKKFEKHPEKGVVYVDRPGRAVGAAASSQIRIKGIDAGGTGAGTFFRWELTPGTYAFSAFTT